MIGKVIDGKYAGGYVHKLPDKNVLFIQTEDGKKVALSKQNAISIEDITDQYPSNAKKILMVMWNDFETSIIQLGGQLSYANTPSTSDRTKAESIGSPQQDTTVPSMPRENKKKPHKTVKAKKRTSLLPKVLVILGIVVLLTVTAVFILNKGSVTLSGTDSFFVSEEQRIEEIKAEGLAQAKEYIREALLEELDDPEDALTKLDSINVSYGLEVIEENTYTITATYKYRLELSHVHADIYYICDVIGDLRTGETTTKLLDYYTSDPEIKVEPEKLFEMYCDPAWAEYKTSEYSDEIVIDTNPNDEKIQSSFTATFIESKKWYNQEADYAIQGINSALGLPSNLRDKIVLLEASDPSGYESFDGFIGYNHLYITYNFHPNRGLVVIYEFSK